MTEDVGYTPPPAAPGEAAPADVSRVAPRPHRPPTSGPRPASRLEITGWVITALGVLVLVYFALTRSF